MLHLLFLFFGKIFAKGTEIRSLTWDLWWLDMGRHLSRYVESNGGLPPNGIVSHKVIPLSDLLNPARMLGIKHKVITVRTVCHQSFNRMVLSSSYTKGSGTRL